MAEGDPTPNPAPWYADLDEVHRGHVTSRGLDKLDAAAAARQLAQDHREAQAAISRIHGIPADQVLRVPKDAADPGWAEVHKRLGRPDKPDDYKIENIAFADGSAPDATFLGHMRALAHELNLPADKAQALAARVVAIADNDASEATRESATQRSANETELRRAWGGQHDYFQFQANRAAQLLGVPDEVVRGMETRPAAEYLKFMDGLRALAGKMGEAELLRGEGVGGNSANLTREEATTRLADLRRDRAWTERFLSGDAAAKTEFENLTKIMVGPPPSAANQSPAFRR